MAVFKKVEVIQASPVLIPTLANHLKEVFEKEEYTVSVDHLSSGGCIVSITKVGFFKAILGMKSALKISLLPQHETILFDASVGIWGQQAIPTAISLFVFWPVLLTQIWGTIQQANLDDKALAIINEVVSTSPMPIAEEETTMKFCTACGHRNSSDARFCSECGHQF